MTGISDIVTIFPIPKANFSTVALLPRDYLLVYLLDIVTILPSSQIKIKSVAFCRAMAGQRSGGFAAE